MGTNQQIIHTSAQSRSWKISDYPFWLPLHGSQRSASEPSFAHCVKQCDHVRRANALQQTISPPQACAPPVPSVTFLIHSSLRQGRACHRDLALCQLLHRTAYRQMRSAPTLPSLFSTWKPVSWSSRPASLCGSHQHTPRAYQIVILPR